MSWLVGRPSGRAPRREGPRVGARTVVAALVGATIVACGAPTDPRCATTAASRAALVEAAPPLPMTPAMIIVEATSTATVWVTRSEKCTSPALERREGDAWVLLRMVPQYRCPNGEAVCPGPVPTAVERVPVGPTPRRLLSWMGEYLLPRDEQCDEDDTPALAYEGRYRVTVPYCTDPAACDALPRVALPSSELCPHTRTATAVVEVLSGLAAEVETARVVLEP